jgi:hypothetical protein
MPELPNQLSPVNHLDPQSLSKQIALLLPRSLVDFSCGCRSD